jgi:di/tripeptidase
MRYIAAQDPMMEIVSIGPTIEGVHTTGERLKVSSLAKVWNLLHLVLQAP